MKSIVLATSLALITVGCGGTASPGGSAALCVHDVNRATPNGWLLKSPVVRFDFWGSYWQQLQPADVGSDEAPTVDGAQDELNTWDRLLNQGPINVLQRLTEYGIGAPIMSDVMVIDNVNVVNSFVDATVGDELNAEIQRGDIAAPSVDGETLYVVVLPPNVLSAYMIAQGAGGYHSWATYGTTKYAFAIVKFRDDIALSHEIYEAVTDPGDGSGYIERNSGKEIGDFCKQSSEIINGYNVQKVWSQAACQCE